jgi:hypothetical protein
MKGVRGVILMEQQTPQPSVLRGCVALLLIIFAVWWCLFRQPSTYEAPKSTTPPTPSLRPDELKRHRQTFVDFQSTISIYRARYNGCVSTWQKIFNDLSRHRISALQAYERLQALQKAADLLRWSSWKIPESLPKDVYDLLRQAENDYSLAAKAFYEAIGFAMEFLDTGSANAYTKAKERLRWANSHILEADLAIAKAKKKLGF